MSEQVTVCGWPCFSSFPKIAALLSVAKTLISYPAAESPNPTVMLKKADHPVNPDKISFYLIPPKKNAILPKKGPSNQPHQDSPLQMSSMINLYG